MDLLAYQPKAHLFVCCRQREGKPCCNKKGAESLVAELKKWIKETGVFNQIKVSKTSCLGYCDTGISACLYPQNKWFHEIQPDQLEKLKQMLTHEAKKDSSVS